MTRQRSSNSWRPAIILADINVLIYAFRDDMADHRRYKAWLEGVVNGMEAFGMSDLVLSGVLRVVTNPRALNPPSTMERALAFVESVRQAPNCVPVHPGPRHWEIFTRLCREAGVRGNLVPDAYLAALAIESGSEWITTDRDYSRFADLRWRHPLT